MELIPSEETCTKEVDQGEGFVRPFLKKGTGLSRFYKGKHPDEIITARKKLIPRRSQTQQQHHLKQNPSHHNIPLSEETGEEEVQTSRVNDNGILNDSKNVQNVEDEDDELKLFEALEKAAVTGSFCSTSSLAARFLKTKLDNYDKENPSSKLRPLGKENDESIVVVPSELYSPTSSLFMDSDNDDYKDDEEEVEEVEEENKIRQNVQDILMQKIESLQEENKIGQNMQDILMRKIDSLQEELQSQNQKWYAYEIKVTHKIQDLEEALEMSNEKLAKVKTKMQKIIDTLQQDLHDKNVECAENHELLLNRIITLENEKKLATKDLRKPHKKAPEPIKEESIRDSIQSMEDNIFGDDGELGITKILPNGDKETLYSNGTRKLIAHDFSEMKHLYTNGDVRTVKRDGTVKYYYAESATWHTTYTNGVEYYEFANGQTERRNPNGIIEVVFPNGCVKYSHPSGTEECIFADNTILRVDSNGERAVVLPNGQQEIHGTDYKKRIYPDGTAKTVYNDGSQETRYPNGRVRIKDSQGVLLADISSPSKSKLSPRTNSSEKSQKSS